jgi:hypothetical protein
MRFASSVIEPPFRLSFPFNIKATPKSWATSFGKLTSIPRPVLAGQYFQFLDASEFLRESVSKADAEIGIARTLRFKRHDNDRGILKSRRATK